MEVLKGGGEHRVGAEVLGPKKAFSVVRIGFIELVVARGVIFDHKYARSGAGGEGALPAVREVISKCREGYGKRHGDHRENPGVTLGRRLEGAKHIPVGEVLVAMWGKKLLGCESTDSSNNISVRWNSVECVSQAHEEYATLSGAR